MLTVPTTAMSQIIVTVMDIVMLLEKLTVDAIMKALVALVKMMIIAISAPQVQLP